MAQLNIFQKISVGKGRSYRQLREPCQCVAMLRIEPNASNEKSEQRLSFIHRRRNGEDYLEAYVDRTGVGA